MGDPIGKIVGQVGGIGEDWLRARNKEAWEKVLKTHGARMIEGAISDRERRERLTAFENAFNHVHGAAIVRSLAPAPIVAALGNRKEENTWASDQKSAGQRRDVYGDLWNDKVGDNIAAKRPMYDVRQGPISYLRDASVEAVLDGTAIVRKWDDPHADPEHPEQFRGDVRLQGVSDMDLSEMQRSAPQAAEQYLNAWGKARSQPYPQPVYPRPPLPLGRQTKPSAMPKALQRPPLKEPQTPLAKELYRYYEFSE